MTKKDYIRAAKMVKEMRIEASNLVRGIGGAQRVYEENVASEVELVFIKFFRDDNPRFDQLRFLEACDPRK